MKQIDNKYFSIHQNPFGEWIVSFNHCVITFHCKDYPKYFRLRNTWRERGIKESKSFKYLLELGRIYIQW